jgi:hypothetical protein
MTMSQKLMTPNQLKMNQSMTLHQFMNTKKKRKKKKMVMMMMMRKAVT